MTETDMITSAQAAVILGCRPRTVARMVEDGRLEPALKFPGWRGGYLFTRAEVERAAIEQQTRAQAS
jgi:excisionase family DNA binding protein